jgi:hypothetical protein
MERIICEIEYNDPRRVSELADVWIVRKDENETEGKIIAAYRNVTVQVNKLGVEIFRNNQSMLKGMFGIGNPDEVISIVYRNTIDEIVDRRNVVEK